MRKYKFCFKTCIPQIKHFRTWGDYYLAKSFGEALKRKGHEYTIQAMSQWYTNQDYDADIVIHLRGLNEYKTKPNHFNIMWNISHPANVCINEYNNYDLVLIASFSHFDKISSSINKPSRPFLQFTDTNLFFPEYVESHKTDILFVGNSRKIYRPIVKEAIENNLPISVVGKNWGKIIEKKYIKNEWFENEKLRHLYSSCNVLLNDHWNDMKEFGFVNNRLFDAFACRAIVINDTNQEVSKIFPEAIIIDEHKGLVDIVNNINENYADYYKKAEILQGEVLNKHTADIRASQLLEIISDIGFRNINKGFIVQKPSLQEKVKNLIIKKRGYGKWYSLLLKPYKFIKKKKYQFAYYKSKLVPKNIIAIKEKNFLICFLVNENMKQTTSGDYFSAKGLGDELERLYGYTPLYLSRNAPYQWNDIPRNTDIVVSMLHDTDIKHINIPKQSIKIAWMRSYMVQWIKSSQINEYDGVITSSKYWENVINNEMSPNLCWGTVPLGLSHEYFEHVEKFSNHKTRDIDVCFVGNVSSYYRQVVRDLNLSNEFNFHFYGSLNAQYDHPWRKYHKGSLIHSDIYKIYDRSKIVLEDTTEMTYNTINLRTYEAAASGALIIANETPGLVELLEGNVVIYKNSSDLAKKILYYLEHNESREIIAQKAQNIIKKHHTFSQRAELFHKIISSKINNKRGG